jgi:hypothetical protein
MEYAGWRGGPDFIPPTAVKTWPGISERTERIIQLHGRAEAAHLGTRSSTSMSPQTETRVVPFEDGRAKPVHSAAHEEVPVVRDRWLYAGQPSLRRRSHFLPTLCTCIGYIELRRKYTGWCTNDFAAGARPARVVAQLVRGSRVYVPRGHSSHATVVDMDLGFHRIVVS